MSNIPEYTVSQISSSIKMIIEDAFGYVPKDELIEASVKHWQFSQFPIYVNSYQHTSTDGWVQQTMAPWPTRLVEFDESAFNECENMNLLPKHSSIVPRFVSMTKFAESE